MKKILTASFLAVLAAASIWAQTKSPFKAVGADLPPLHVIDRNSKEYTEKDINPGRHFFLVLFNPTCSHCMDMARLFGTHEDAFKNNTVIFVAARDMMPYFDHFYEGSDAGNYRNIAIGIDSSDLVNNLYKYGNLPQVNIYDKNKKLVRIFSGETPLDSLVRYAD